MVMCADLRSACAHCKGRSLCLLDYTIYLRGGSSSSTIRLGLPSFLALIVFIARQQFLQVCVSAPPAHCAVRQQRLVMPVRQLHVKLLVVLLRITFL